MNTTMIHSDTMNDSISQQSVETIEEEPWETLKKTLMHVFAIDSLWVTPISKVILTIAYTCTILVGVTGNLLVLVAIFRSPSMRNARNVFIGNLAFSDICLCLITMPLTLIECTYKNWHWGDSPLFCRLTSPLQAISVFVSVLSITAIAVDRCTVICFPSIPDLSTRNALMIVPIVWITAICLASPLAIFKELLSLAEVLLAEGTMLFSDIVSFYATKKNVNTTSLYKMEYIANRIHRNNMTDQYETLITLDKEKIPHSCFNVAKQGCPYDSMFFPLIYNFSDQQIEQLQVGNLSSFTPRELHSTVISAMDFMIEQMNMDTSRVSSHPKCIEAFPQQFSLIYTVLIMVVQYLLPVVTVSLANRSIYRVLQERVAQYNSMAMTTNKFSSSAIQEKREKDVLRMKRTMILLISIGAIFIVCWLPLTIFNIVNDMGIDSISSLMIEDPNKYFSIFACCHLAGMLSACANPILYGFLNESFKTEFKDMFTKVTGVCRGRRGNEVATRNTNTLETEFNDTEQIPLNNGKSHA